MFFFSQLIVVSKSLVSSSSLHVCRVFFVGLHTLRQVKETNKIHKKTEDMFYVFSYGTLVFFFSQIVYQCSLSETCSPLLQRRGWGVGDGGEGEKNETKSNLIRLLSSVGSVGPVETVGVQTRCTSRPTIYWGGESPSWTLGGPKTPLVILVGPSPFFNPPPSVTYVVGLLL